MRPLKILTWPTHGCYLSSLAHVPHEFYVLSAAGSTPRLGANLHALPATQARAQQFDCIMFHDIAQYEKEQYEFLSATQRALPRIYVEHAPPVRHPTDSRHPVDDPNVLLVHVAHFNALMWDCGRTPTRVIEHGVTLPSSAEYRGDRAGGLSIVNHLARGERRLGADIFCLAREHVALDLIGLGSEELGGLGPVDYADLPAFAARYRFLFHPVRYASVGIPVIEAMLLGMPVVALATAEMATVIENAESGYIDTNLDTLVARMQELSHNPALARQLGATARRRARERFGIERFCADWNAALAMVTGSR